MAVPVTLMHLVESLERRESGKYRLRCSCGRVLKAEDAIQANVKHELHLIDCSNKSDAGV